MVLTFEPVIVTLAGTLGVVPEKINLVFVLRRTVTEVAFAAIETFFALALEPSKIGCKVLGVFGAGFATSTGGCVVKPPPVDPPPPLPPPEPPPPLGGLIGTVPAVVIELD